MKKLAWFITIMLIIGFTSSAMAGQVTLKWDANDPAPEGYKIFARAEGQANYDYSAPAWSGPETTATIELTEGVLYYMVVRAFEGVLESPNSEEVNYAMPTEGINVPGGFSVERVIIININ